MGNLERYKKTASYIFFWGLGFLLLYLAFRNQDLGEIWETFKSADLTWAGVVLLISIFSHFIRAFRWRLLIKPLGYTPSIWELFVGLLFGYFVSSAIPRLGEVSRCIAVNRTQKVPFTPLLGTVVTERIIDIFCLFIVVLLALVVEYDVLHQFYFQEVHAGLSTWFISNFNEIRVFGITFILVGTLALALIISKWKIIKKILWVRKVLTFTLKISRGIFSIFRMKDRIAFLAFTLIIWICYFLMTYLWFFSFQESSHLSLGAGLALMVIGSVGRSLPIQGNGLGAYHFLFTKGALLYGISEIHSLTLATMIHGLQTIYYLIVGGLLTLYLMFIKKVIK